MSRERRRDMKNKKLISQLSVITIGIIIFKAITDFPGFMRGVSLILQFFQPFFIAFTIAYLLYPLIKILDAKVFSKIKGVKKASYGLGVLTAYIILIFIVGILLNIVIPQLGALIQALATLDYGAIGQILRETLASVQNTYGLFEGFDANNLTVTFTRFITGVFSPSNLSSLFSGVLGVTLTLFTWFLGIILSIYMLIERDSIFATIKAAFSLVLSEVALEKLIYYTNQSHRMFISFLFGQAFDSFIIGIIAMIGFYLLGVPFAFPMGLVVMVFNMVPMLGPIIGAIPAIALTLVDTGNFMAAFWVGIFMLALQQFDGNILGPRIVGDSVGVSVFWILAAITIMGSAFGFIGILFAVPAAGVIRLIFIDYYTYRKTKKQQAEVDMK